MIFMKKVLLLFATLALITSCGLGKKTHISSLEFRNEQRYVYQNGEAFTGDAWSSDEKTVCMHAESGVVTGFTMYYENGTIAVKASTNGVKDSVVCYDKKGNVITEDQIEKMYPSFYQRVKALSHEINEIDR